MSRYRLLNRVMVPAISRGSHRSYSLLAGFTTLLMGMAPASTWAQQTQADLSVSATVTPPYFIPGQRNTVALTVHNDGPDALDIHPPYSIVVGGEAYFVTTLPPPYEVIVPADGCGVERFVTEPLPDGNIALQFVFYFDVLSVGASRTCTYDIEYYPSAQPPLTLEWNATTWYVLDNIDPDPSNNMFRYSLSGAPLAPPAPVPTGSRMAWLLLGFGLASLALGRMRSTGV